MKVLLSWLREFAPFDADPAELGDALSMLGLAVESMERLGAGLDGVIVARVLARRAHPDADRVQLVDVDAGGPEPLQIVCGAFNMADGDLVPLATVGAELPDGRRIERRKVRGQWSNGMLCSPPELGLAGDPGGILVLAGAHEPGEPLRDALGIGDDVLYDLEVNPNRPDAMGVAGVARDLAARFGLPFSLPSPAVTADASLSAADLARVDIVDPDLCGRFVARVLRGVTMGPSPAWLANRLTLLGMRPINHVVDVSNYVMLELGQPSHAYDLRTLPDGAIRVRRATDGEQLVTLDGVTRTFGPDDLLICDGGDVAIGVAGIIGGESTEIADSTTDVLVEMAWFQPMAIARTARRLGVRTEASARFERGCDPFVIDRAGDRFVELLGAAGGRMAAGAVDARGELLPPARVRVRPARVNAVLGTELSGDDIGRYLEPIGFGVHDDGTGALEVTVPSFRPDTALEIDVVEEVARHHGYDRLGSVVPPSVHIGALTRRQRDRRAVRATLAGLGLCEAMPMPFLAPADVERAGLAAGSTLRILNPLVAEESVLRTSLLPGLLKAVAHNEAHRNDGVWLFEVGHVFARPAAPQPLPDEREHLGVALAGAEAPEAARLLDALLRARGYAAHRLRAAEPPGLHPTRSAAVAVAGTELGVVGEVDPAVAEAFAVHQRVAWLELDLGLLLELPHAEEPYRPVSRYPSSDVDLAFDVDDAVPADEVAAALRQGAGDLLVRLELFDVYRGAGIERGRRSLAYRLRFQAPDRTLTDEDVASVRQRAIDAVERATSARLRG